MTGKIHSSCGASRYRFEFPFGDRSTKPFHLTDNDQAKPHLRSTTECDTEIEDDQFSPTSGTGGPSLRENRHSLRNGNGR
jgi:hypothetical protein